MKHFIVRDLFSPRLQFCNTPQCMSNDFKKYIYDCSKDMVIDIPEKLPPLEKVVEKEGMTLFEIYKEAGYITLQKYWLTLYMLLYEPSLGTTEELYTFFVKIGEDIYYLPLSYESEELGSVVYSQDRIYFWDFCVCAAGLSEIQTDESSYNPGIICKLI